MWQADCGVNSPALIAPVGHAVCSRSLPAQRCGNEAHVAFRYGPAALAPRNCSFGHLRLGDRRCFKRIWTDHLAATSGPPRLGKLSLEVSPSARMVDAKSRLRRSGAAGSGDAGHGMGGRRGRHGRSAWVKWRTMNDPSMSPDARGPPMDGLRPQGGASDPGMGSDMNMGRHETWGLTWNGDGFRSYWAWEWDAGEFRRPRATPSPRTASPYPAAR